MSNLVKKTILASLGALSLTRKKAKKIAKDLIKWGELAKTEKAKLVKDLTERAKKTKAKWRKK